MSICFLCMERGEFASKSQGEDFRGEGEKEEVGKVSVDELTPREIVDYLSRYIIGQDSAKKAIAIALRNRVRRMKIPEHLREEITPKNILMIGPTGVGKTEMCRRIAKLVDAPFLKVEATRYTEVGYVGRDVESIIRDLVNLAVSEEKARERKKVREKAKLNAINQVADIIVRQKGYKPEDKGRVIQNIVEGKFDEEEVEVTAHEHISVDVIAAPLFPGMEGLADQIEQIKSIFENFGRRRGKKRMKVKDAIEFFTNQEADKLINQQEVVRRALWKVENKAIVFIDEIDKLINPRGGHGPDVSGEGVQRDLLPLLDGTTITTRWGSVRTDFILFIAAGAFHNSSPSDLIPELQGRLPIRVELHPLGKEEFVRILKETENSILKHYQLLLKTEGVELEFTDDAIELIAEYADLMNRTTENIGARRLHTIVEKVVEDISFDAPALSGQKITIDAKYVEQKIKPIIEDRELSKYIL